MSIIDGGQVEHAREMAQGFVEDHLEGDEETSEAVAEASAPSLFSDNRAQAGGSAMKAVSLVVALTVGGIVAAFLLPIAIEELVNVSTTGWSDGAAALWNILDVIVVLAVFLFFVGVALAASSKI